MHDQRSTITEATSIEMRSPNSRWPSLSVPGDGEWQVQVSRRDEYRAANARGQSEDRGRQSAASGEVSETRYARLIGMSPCPKEETGLRARARHRSGTRYKRAAVHISNFRASSRNRLQPCVETLARASGTRTPPFLNWHERVPFCPAFLPMCSNE